MRFAGEPPRPLTAAGPCLFGLGAAPARAGLERSHSTTQVAALAPPAGAWSLGVYKQKVRRPAPRRPRDR